MPPKKRGYYTAEEVAAHNNEKSLWVIMNRKVYDVTVFHKRHPGGSAVLLQMGGRDATAAATAAHKTILPGNLMWEFCIGSIVRNKKPEVSPKAVEAGSEFANVTSLPMSTVQSLPSPLPNPSVAPPLPPPAQAPPSAAPSAKASPTPLVSPKTATSSSPPMPVVAPKAKGKAKAKTPAVVERLESRAEKTEVDAASSGSKSVQGSVGDDQSPESDSDQTDTEFNSVLDFFFDTMSSDPKLAKWVVKSDKNELLFEVRRFLASLLEGSDIRRNSSSWSNKLKSDSPKAKKGSKADMKEFRSRLEKRYRDFADIMACLMRRPFPLGEDMFVANLGALSQAVRSEENDMKLLVEEFCSEKQIEKFIASIRFADTTPSQSQDRFVRQESPQWHLSPSRSDPEASSPDGLSFPGQDVKVVEDAGRISPAEISKHEASSDQAIAWLCTCLADGRSRTDKLR